MNKEFRSKIAAKIAKILSEYPSHPPMNGSEYGINEISINKLVDLFDDEVSAQKKEIVEMCEGMKKELPLPVIDQQTIKDRNDCRFYNFALDDIINKLK